MGDDTWAPLGSGFCWVMACGHVGSGGSGSSEARRHAGVSSVLTGLLG